MADYLVQEDGTSKLLLETSGALLLESAPDEIDPPFIGSVTTLYAPAALVPSLPMPFIQAGRIDSFPLSEDFLYNPAEFENGLGQSYDDFTLDSQGANPAVFPPTLPEVNVGFIASVTVVYAVPAIPEVTPSFIPSVSTLYGPTLYFTNDITITTAGTFSWLCPPGVTRVLAEAYGAGGGGENGGLSIDVGGGGGGGGAWAGRSIAVTPGTLYTIVIGTGGGGGNPGSDGASSSFTGDSGVQVIAVGGTHGTRGAGGAGGQASACTGDTKFSGGDGGGSSSNAAGGGGGASGNSLATGANGATSSGGLAAGGTGTNGGGTGGNGGFSSSAAQDGTAPGGGGGGAKPTLLLGGSGADGGVKLTVGFVLPVIGSTTTVYTPGLPEINAPFIASTTTLYGPLLVGPGVTPGFIASVTVVYAPSLPEVEVPFIVSQTHVWNIFSTFNPAAIYSGVGNGGETFLIRLAPNGVTEIATLTGDITTAATQITVTGDSGFPATVPFVVIIDNEVLYVSRITLGVYRIRQRAMSNTTSASHTAGASVTWTDSYEAAIVAGGDIAHSFTADINSTGTYTYDGWLICFDSSQAYLGGDRYPTHVAEVVGVFDAGAGTTGTNRCDSSQPNAIATPSAVSDDCPAALSNPALITTDIVTGDVAVVRYTNPEATVLDLGPRSVALQSWFGLKRVDASDNDVTLTDPTGYVVDTHPSGAGPGPFTGSVNQEWANPIPLLTGIAPDASDAARAPVPTPNPVPWTTVTLPGTDRYFTYGSAGGGFDEKGWPMCCLAVRQGNRRVPFWQSWDWHDYSYVYAGFGTDDTFCQLLINRNGIVFGSVPSVELPGAQDIDGPDAVWDDATYDFAASWYVVLFGTPYIVFGPTIGGTISGVTISGAGGVAPGVTFPPGGGHVIIPPPFVEGGSGGNIGVPGGGLHVWQTS